MADIDLKELKSLEILLGDPDPEVVQAVNNRILELGRDALDYFVLSMEMIPRSNVDKKLVRRINSLYVELILSELKREMSTPYPDLTNGLYLLTALAKPTLKREEFDQAYIPVVEEVVKELNRAAKMLENGCDCAVIEFDLLVKQGDVSKLVYDAVCGIVYPNGVVREVIGANSAVNDGSRAVSRRILVCQNSLKALPSKSRVKRAEAFGVTRHVAVSVMADTRPARAHIRRVFVEVVKGEVKILIGSFDKYTVCFLKSRSLYLFKQSLSGFGAEAFTEFYYFILGVQIANAEGYLLAFSRLKLARNFKRKARLFCGCIRVFATASFHQSLGLFL
jgi:hypothetical protein